MTRVKAVVEYWKVPCENFDRLDDLCDPEFIKANGTLFKSYHVSNKNKFERLENEFWAKDDAMYPHIIYGEDLPCEESGKWEITTGTAGMIEDWDIVRDAYGFAV